LLADTPLKDVSLPARVATFRNCSIFHLSPHDVFCHFEQKSHVASKKHIVLISLSTGGRSSMGVPLNHSAATRRRTDDHHTTSRTKGYEKGISARRSHVTERSEQTGGKRRERSGR
jgi:hypothetical protein